MVLSAGPLRDRERGSEVDGAGGCEKEEDDGEGDGDDVVAEVPDPVRLEPPAETRAHADDRPVDDARDLSGAEMGFERPLHLQAQPAMAATASGVRKPSANATPSVSAIASLSSRAQTCSKMRKPAEVPGSSASAASRMSPGVRRNAPPDAGSAESPLPSASSVAMPSPSGPS